MALSCATPFPGSQQIDWIPLDGMPGSSFCCLYLMPPHGASALLWAQQALLCLSAWAHTSSLACNAFSFFMAGELEFISDVTAPCENVCLPPLTTTWLVCNLPAQVLPQSLILTLKSLPLEGPSVIPASVLLPAPFPSLECPLLPPPLHSV